MADTAVLRASPKPPPRRAALRRHYFLAAFAAATGGWGPGVTFFGPAPLGQINGELALDKTSVGGAGKTPFVDVRSGFAFSAVGPVKSPIEQNGQNLFYNIPLFGSGSGAFVDGTMQGAFYGNNAQRTAGIWSVRTLTNTAGLPPQSNVFGVGSFSAKR